MDTGLVVAVLLAVAFAVTNGLHDASNAIATLVATRAATPGQAIVLASVFNLLGPLARRRRGRRHDRRHRQVAPSAAVEVIGGGLVAAVTWNLATWRLGLPSSSGHALVGGLVGREPARGRRRARCAGAAWTAASGRRARRADRARGLPPSARWAALLVIRGLRRAGAPGHPSLARRRFAAAQWVTSAALAFSHGANDAQKSVGVIAALLLADGRINTLGRADLGDTPLRGRADRRHGAGRMADHSHRGPPHLSHRAARRACQPGGVGGRHPGASLVGAPTSTTQVVASSVVGVGAGRRRWHHVHWALVRQMGLAWLVTMPVTARSPPPPSGSGELVA